MTPVNQTAHRHLQAWSLGLKQNLIRGLAAHVRTGTSYRIANIDENRCYTAPCTLLKPQTSRDHELGLAWTSSATTASIVVFRSDLENELYFNRLAGAFGSNINMTPTRREGVELAGRWDPLSVLSLSARYTLTHASFRSGVYNGIDVTGKIVPVVPRHRASLLANWSITQRDQLHAGVNYVGSQHYDNDPANRFAKMPSYTTVDTKYSHRIGDATLALAVNNLFDRKYYSYALVNSPSSPTSYNVYPDRSRTAMATFDYKFR
jgi:iron complex outermembrane receptor protein